MINIFKRKKKPIYIFHHIPKCGGTSLRDSFNKWFEIKSDYIPFDKITEESIHNKYNLSKFKSNQCLCGHFEVNGVYLYQRYPEVFNNERYKVFTFIREPLELIISLYYYEKMVGRGSELELKEYIFKRTNYLANRFPCTIDDYKEVLNNYFFIGITEQMSDSIKLLSKKIGKINIKINNLNISKKDKQITELSEDIKNKFKEKNKLDYLIYSYCIKKFNNDLTKYNE